MSNRPTRARVARIAVGLASLAFPLIVTGAAQAAIAGATPASTAIPDARSAFIQSTAGSGGVEVCFDKTLSGDGANAADVNLVGYRAGNVSAAATPVTLSGSAIDRTSGSCPFGPSTGLLLSFPSSVGTLSQYTAVEIPANAVTGLASNQGNLADTVGLTGSTSHDGTTGITVAPNLVGILAPTGTNQNTNSLTFVFDRNVAATGRTASDFFYVDQAGNVCFGSADLSNGGSPVTSASTLVTITFAGGSGTCTTPIGSGTVRGGVLVNAVTSDQDTLAHNASQAVVLPGAANGGATQRPDLVSAALGSDNDSITYTFDKPVTLGSGTGVFDADLADGQVLASSVVTTTGTTTVTARFNGNLAKQAEFGVIAFVPGGAVQANDNATASGGNVPGSAPIGGNAGAFSRAFTTAPDVFGVTANKTTGVVTVNLDDRLATTGTAVTPADVTLVDGNGAAIPSSTTPTVSYNSSAGPGPAMVTLQYPPSTLTNLVAVEFAQSAFVGALSNTVTAADAESVPQLVGTVNSSAILKAYKAYKAHHKTTKHSKKHTKKHAKKH